MKSVAKYISLLVLTILAINSIMVGQTFASGFAITSFDDSKIPPSKYSTLNLDMNQGMVTRSVDGHNYCYSKNSEVYHVTNCGHLPAQKNRLYSETIPAGKRLCNYC